MEMRRLGRSEISVSALCLGSMTWGEQNTEAEAFEQLDHARAAGINFIDTAEMYPVAPRAETFGRTEEIIGNWLAARGGRDRTIVATKVTGPAARFPYVRDGKPRLNKTHITAAIEDSLKRLRTDYVDLYQLHWPDRTGKSFGALGYDYDPQADETPIEETLSVLDDLVRAGKVRAIGLSNERPWGVMRFLGLADAGRGPRAVSIQNPYSLLNRSFETSLAEVAIRESCGLLAYAPQAAGTLTGKYLNGQQPAGARRTLWPDNLRYQGAQADAAVAAYVDLARASGLDPAQMALAFVLAQPFLTAAIIGATSLAHLRNGIAAARLTLPPDVRAGIESIHRVHTYPCP